MNNEFLTEFYNRIKTAGLSDEQCNAYMTNTFGAAVKQAQEEAQPQVHPLVLAQLEGFYNSAKEAGLDEQTLNGLTNKYAEYLSQQG